LIDALKLSILLCILPWQSLLIDALKVSTGILSVHFAEAVIFD